MNNEIQFTTIELDKINVWNKQINSSDIAEKRNEIYDFIKKSYTNKNTIKSHLNTLGSVLKKLNKFPDDQKKFIDEAILINNQVTEEAKNQELSDNRKNKQTPFSEIVKYRDKLFKLFENNPTHSLTNIRHLILSLYSYQPPIRRDYKKMEIIYKEPENTNTKDEKKE